MNRNELVIQALKDLKIDQSQVDETRFEMALLIAIASLEKQLKLQELGFTDDVLDNYKKFEDECIANGFTFNSLIEAREKQIPKKIVGIKDKRNFNGNIIYKIGCCPDCGTEIVTPYGFCRGCGLKLNWN